MLSSLGARVLADEGKAPLSYRDRAYPRPSTSAAQDWVESGASPLTGRADGPELSSASRPATFIRGVLLAFDAMTDRWGRAPAIDGATLLSERAALTARTRNGATSVGGATRLLRSEDNWIALSLARESDHELVPALIEADAGNVVDDPWPSVAAWIQGRSSAQVVERATLLGLPVAELGETRPSWPPWNLTRRDAGRAQPTARPLVVNLGALWAGPLCAQLLAQAGCRVIDVESARRRDPTRDTYAGVLVAATHRPRAARTRS